MARNIRLGARTRRLLRNFETAAINLSWKGNCEPDEWPSIEFKYIRAREALTNHLVKMKSLIINIGERDRY